MARHTDGIREADRRDGCRPEGGHQTVAENRYTRVAMTLHWIIAAGIIANVALYWLWETGDRGVVQYIRTHKSIGVTLGGLALMRLAWRWRYPAPSAPPHHQRWERSLSHVVHIGLYVVMLGLPLSGWLMDSAWAEAAHRPMYWFGTFKWPRLGLLMEMEPAARASAHALLKTLHASLGYILYLLFALHVAGALKHQFLDRDRILSRMWS